MKRFFKNRCVFGFIVIVIIFSIIIGIVNCTNTEATLGENILNVTVTPVQKFFTWIGDGISDFFGYFGDKDDLKNEIENLKKENADLQTALGQISLAKAENDELRGLLALDDAFPEHELAFGEVIARDPSNWHSSFTIDIGSADGVAVNQPVLSHNKTLVGRVCEVGTTWAKVATVFDPEHSVGAVISRSGEYGIVEGNSEAAADGNCILSYLSKKSDIIVGDIVMTSGLGGVFPDGIVIGTVKEIKAGTDGTSMMAVIVPEAEIESLRAVCIIQNPATKLR